jgi:hypothetical protein
MLSDLMGPTPSIKCHGNREKEKEKKKKNKSSRQQ